ncbi:VCBS repeat-containing protein [Streptomyces sp. NPDC026206]|uniref:FG-GAP repeat domain-containing protein n=1 Tax=Streptomyces sp. NPDC026206 TaxID=3157089 RepID=UPI0033FD0214
MTTTGDFDGDGKTDIATLTNYGQSKNDLSQAALWVHTASGDGFKEPRAVWGTGTGGLDAWRWDASKLTAGDFNGDRRTDIGVLYNYGKTDGSNKTGLWTFTSNGKGFEAPVRVWKSGPVSWNWNSSKLTSGDFNGDKKADLAVLYGYGKSSDGRNETALFFTANGKNGFNEPRKVWNSLEWQNSSGSWSWDSSKIASGDFDGDGKVDVAVLYDYGVVDGRNKTGLWVFPGTDNGFGDPRKVWESGKGSTDSWNWNTSELTAGDFNGDGKADISVTYDFGQGADGRNEAALWTFTSKGDGFNEPRKVWTNKL